jgi:hypothetical protein
MALQVRLLPDALVNLKCDEQFGPFVYWHRTAAPQAAKAGSTPARVIQWKKNFVNRCGNSEEPAAPVARHGYPHPPLAERKHAITNDQVVELVDTRRSERRAPEAWEFDSPLGHLKQRIVNSRSVNSHSVNSRNDAGGPVPSGAS